MIWFQTETSFFFSGFEKITRIIEKTKTRIFSLLLVQTCFAAHPPPFNVPLLISDILSLFLYGVKL